MDDGAIFGKPEPPQNGEAEQALLGVLMQFGQRALDRIGPALRPEHFYHSGHGAVFQVIKEIIASGATPDLVTVGIAMRDDPKFAEIGGRPYLARIFVAAGTFGAGGPEITIWVREVIDCWARRTALDLADDTTSRIRQGGGDALGEAIAALHRGLEDIAVARDDGASRKPKPHERLALGAWLARDIPMPDYLCGEWLSTSSRAIITATTGLGKSNFVLAMATAIAAGQPFLHWAASSRPRRCLYIDGEMSRRLMRTRLEDAVRRSGCAPDNLFILCRDDDEALPPLNTKAGQDYVDRVIADLGGIDLIIFDNIMSLIIGDMKEELGWSDTLPWIKNLTGRGIAQIWVHHAGHDGSRGYGTSTRLWQLDTAIHLEPIEGATADIAFRLKFTKARERTPQNRLDFCDVDIALSDDRWTAEPSERQTSTKKQPSPKAIAFHGALTDALVAHGQSRAESAGRPAVTVPQWKGECVRLGLLDGEESASSRALISKYRMELIAAGWAACNGSFLWSTRASR